MIEITDKSLCCGCTACASICPVDAIKMQEDREGFLYPVAAPDICIECGLCEKVCPELHPEEMRKTPLKTMAFQHNDEGVLKQSSSGGAFSILAEHVISQGGVVFGAQFDEKWEVVHSFARTMEEVAAFRGSKYVQSRLDDTFIKIKSMLDCGETVLFTGTPCQVTGLKRFLRKEYENLITMDFICHGVPSPAAWRIYLKETFHKEHITDIRFRDKSTGWKNYSFHGKSDKREILQQNRKNAFMNAFLKNNILRPSCHTCKIKVENSCSDVTIGDFWGADRLYPDFDDDRGCSLVMIHTPKAMEIFQRVKASRSMEITFDEACRYNPSTKEPAWRPAFRKRFFQIMSRTGSIVLSVKLNRMHNFIARLKKKAVSMLNH